MAILSDLVKAGVVVNGSNGIDLDATMGKLKAALYAELEAQAGTDAKIEAALDTLFDGVEAGKAIPTDACIGKVANDLAGGDILAVAEWTVAVRDFLSRSARFTGKRGRNGGVIRVG